MIVLRFKKFGTLWSYNGIPVYIGGRCITRNRMCWWWPVNWIVTPLLIPVAVWRMLRARKSPTPPDPQP